MNVSLKFLRVVQGPGVHQWVESRLGGVKIQELHSIGLLEPEGPDLMAGVIYTNFTGPNLETHIAIQGRLTREYLWAIFDWPFNIAGCKRITALVDSVNKKSIKLVESLGFDLEARIHSAAASGQDTLVYRMWKTHCRWISPQFTARFGKVRHG